MEGERARQVARNKAATSHRTPQEEFLGHSADQESLETTQIYTHVMRKPGFGVRSPHDRFGKRRGSVHTPGTRNPQEFPCPGKQQTDKSVRAPGNTRTGVSVLREADGQEFPCSGKPAGRSVRAPGNRRTGVSALREAGGQECPRSDGRQRSGRCCSFARGASPGVWRELRPVTSLVRRTPLSTPGRRIGMPDFPSSQIRAGNFIRFSLIVTLRVMPFGDSQVCQVGTVLTNGNQLRPQTVLPD